MELPMELKCGCFLLEVSEVAPAAPARKHIKFQLCPFHSEHIEKFLTEANLETVK